MTKLKEEMNCPVDEPRIALLLLLDAIDYQRGACRVNEMIGAVLPAELLSRARAAAVRK